MANFQFPSPTALSDLGGSISRYHHNLTALKVLKESEAESRDATPDEQIMLSHYSGWGDSETHKKAFPNGNGENTEANPEIAAILTKEEQMSLEGSILNAHYTSLPIVKAIWNALLYYGIKADQTARLRILEPAVGASGNFIGMRPTEFDAGVNFHAVEIDPLSARIFQALYPDMRIFNQGFEDIPFPHKYYDLIISNVPFSQVGVVDKTIKESALKQSLHDYFFVKAVQLAKPDGVIAFITSRYTMDKQKKAVRAYLRRHCELLAAVRLPETAFQENAGTQVVTDILILRKKTVQEIKEYRLEEGEGKNCWLDLTWSKFQGQYEYRSVEINSFFAEHPQYMLGRPSIGHGMHNEATFRLKPHEGLDTAKLVTEALCQQLPKGRWQYHNQEEVADEVQFEADTREPTDGMVKEPDKDRKFTDLLIGTYHATKKLIQAESQSASEEPLEELRRQLNSIYGDFYQLYGPINEKRNTLRLEKTHPCVPLLLSLEEKNQTGQFIPAAIFTRRIVRGEDAITDKLTVHEALILSYNKYGQMNIRFIADILKITAAEAFTQLGDEIFQDPNGTYLPRAEYLSGNIQEKLEEAKRAVLFDNSFQRNVEALEAILPTPLTPGEVPVRLGSPWIPEDIIKDFIQHLIPSYDGEYCYVEFIPPLTSWKLNIDTYPASHSIEAKSTWGTARANALWIIQCGLNLKTPNVYDPVLGTDKFIINQPESANAQARLEEIKAEFVNWAWKDASRAERLCQIYNERYNCFVAREYDGSHLTLPGLSNEITPRQHQKDGVWRILQSQNTLLGHIGGAGKTGTMVMAAVEMRRLGIARRPVVAVPNHLPQQWAEEARKFYPGIKLYCPDKNALSSKERGKLLSTIATADYDLIIIPHTAVKYLPLKTETIRAYHEAEINDLRNYLLESGDKKNKEIQRAIKRLENKLKELDARIKRDSEHTITFEECGIDALLIDEFHEFKNLGFTTKAQRVAGMPNTQSQRAYDLFMKARILQERGGRFVGGTGTPISNSLCEVYICQKFYQLERMQDLGIDRFDAWAQTFCDNSQSVEMKPDGSGFRTNTRFNRVTGLPELTTIWREVLDVKTADQINLERPSIFGEKPTVVEIPPSEALKEIIKSLAKRSDNLKNVDPSEDNMLAITNDGRRAALDIRLFKSTLPEPKESKVKEVAKNVAAIYHAYHVDKACQLIFCDLGTPKSHDTEVSEDELLNDTAGEIKDELHNNSFYQAIRNRLIKQGIPTSEIAFIHEAKTAEAKARLFRRMNAGEIRVLIGSTGKCGTGMNAQERLIAIHHLDTPWRPADLDQRNWRGQRPGNKYPQIYIYQYVTTGSFDGYSWAVIESKSRFIAQLMAGRITSRTAENIDDVVLTAAQVKAIASGNPRILEKVGLETELAKLERLYIAWRNDQQKWTRRLAELPDENTALQKKIAHYEQAITLRDGVASSDFTLLENKKEVVYDPDRAEGRLTLFAGVTAKEALHSGTANYKVGKYRGFTLHFSSGKVMASYRDILDCVNLRLRLQIDEQTEIEVSPKLRYGFVHSIQEGARLLEDYFIVTQNKLARNLTDMEAITKQVERPWNHAAKYKDFQQRLNDLNAELTQQGETIENAAEEYLPLEAAEITELQVAAVAEDLRTPTNPLLLSIPTLASLSNDAPVPTPTLATQSADMMSVPAPSLAPVTPQKNSMPTVSEPPPFIPPALNEQLSLFSDFRPAPMAKPRKATTPPPTAQLSLF